MPDKTKNAWFRPVSRGKRKSCPHCKKKLPEAECIWSCGEYIRGKFRGVHDCCISCWPSMRDELLAFGKKAKTKVNISGSQLPDWMTLTVEASTSTIQALYNELALKLRTPNSCQQNKANNIDLFDGYFLVLSDAYRENDLEDLADFVSLLQANKIYPFPSTAGATEGASWWTEKRGSDIRVYGLPALPIIAIRKPVPALVIDEENQELSVWRISGCGADSVRSAVEKLQAIYAKSGRGVTLVED